MKRAMLLTAGVVLTFGSAHAQVVKIWPGVAPGSETWTHHSSDHWIDAFHYWLDAQGLTKAPPHGSR